MADARLEILLTAREMTARAFNDTQQRIDRLNRGAALLKATFVALAAGFTFRGAVRGLGELTTAASDLAEATNKFNVVFRDNAAAASDWTRELTDGYAMSTREARQYLSAVQDMLVPMGMASQAAGQMSSDIVKLAADLGSFNNRRTADVMNDIQSALTGQFMTMRKYGVVLTAAAVEQEAFRLGLARTKDELTAAHKAQAAYSLIVQGSVFAMGDMERTADSHVNTTKRMDAAWEDFTATLGDKFMPAATRIKGVTADILKNLTEAIRGPSLDEQIAALQAEAAAIERRLTVPRRDRDIEQFEAMRERMAARVRAEAERGATSWEEYQRASEAALFGPPGAAETDQKSYLETRLEAINAQIDVLKNQQVDQLLRDAFDLTGVAAPNADQTEADLKKTDELLERYFRSYDQQSQELGREINRFWDDWREHEIDQANQHAQEMIEAFQATQNAVVDMRLDEFFADIDEGYAGLVDKINRHNASIENLSRRTAWAMQQSFADLFFDAMTGRLNTFEDYFNGFMRALQRSFSEYIAQMLMQKAFGEAAGGTGGGWVGAAVNLVGQLASRDSGGPVRPGQMYEIGVPELLSVGNRQYLMMGGNQAGHVQPLDSGAGQPAIESKTTIINVLDPAIVENYLNTPAGEGAVLNIIRRNE